MNMNLDGSIVTFGESLMRLSPPDHLRLRQTTALDLVYGGAEANVAVALANFGVPVQYVTRLPDNEVGIACKQSLRQYGVGTEFIETGGERLGLYFLEAGSGNRPSQVIYDRALSSFATIDENTFHWDRVFADACWFHWSGINPAVSANGARVTKQAVAAARGAGLTISCDLNYRHRLWQWGDPPPMVMPGLVEQCDVLIANNAYLMLDLADLPTGKTPEEAAEVCSRLARAYPNLKQIAMTCRETVSVVEQRFRAVMWQAGQLYMSHTFTLGPIVERVGAGDALVAGLIYGLVTYPDDPQRIIDFAAACAVFKHSVSGDANLASIEEIELLLAPHKGFDILR